MNPVSDKFTVEFIATPDTAVFSGKDLEYDRLTQKVYQVDGKLDTLQNISQGLYEINQVYETDGGARLYLKNSIVLQWSANTSQSEKNSLISQYGLEETKSTRLYTVYSANIPLLASQLIYETGLVRYCHPNFLAEVELHDHIPNDEYFGQQWHLHNTGQEVNDGHFGTADADIDAPEAWDITFGSSDIIVAVIDEGVTSDHPDLPNTRQVRLPGSNFDPDDGLSANDPSPIEDDNHGNSCAGLIAAEIDNNEGEWWEWRLIVQ